MATDLQNLPGRRTSARPVTANRDGILPSRRNTELPNVAIRGDMRTATRGDPSRELSRVLGLGLDTAAGLGQIQTNKDILAAPENRAQGATDASQGKTADPANKAAAYQSAYYGVKMEGELNTLAGGLQPELDGLVANGAGPADLHDHVVARMKEFIDSKVVNIPDADVRAQTAERLASMGAKLQVDLNKAIKDRTDRDLLDTQAGNIQTRLKTGQPLSYEVDVGVLISAGIPAKEAKAQVMTSVLAVAVNPDDPRPELLDQLLASKQADGKTPSLSPEEQMQVNDRLIQAESLVKAKDKKAQDAVQDGLELKWFKETRAGNNVEADIVDHINNGDYPSREGIALLTTFKGLREGGEEGEANESLSLDFRIQLAEGRADPRVLRAKAAEAYLNGGFGTGLAAKRAYAGVLDHVMNQIESNSNKAERAADRAANSLSRRDTSVSREFLVSQIKPSTADLFGAKVPEKEARAYAENLMRWNDDVAKGMDPRAATDAALARYKSYSGTTGGSAASNPGRYDLAYTPNGGIQPPRK